MVLKETSSDERESTVLVVRDEFSGFFRAFPFTRRTNENLMRCLLAFLSRHASNLSTQ